MIPSSIFLDVVVFFLAILVTDLRFMPILLLVLELWLFLFIRDWPENQKSETPVSGFCPRSGDWEELGMSLIESYWMPGLQLLPFLSQAKNSFIHVILLNLLNYASHGPLCLTRPRCFTYAPYSQHIYSSCMPYLRALKYF